ITCYSTQQNDFLESRCRSERENRKPFNFVVLLAMALSVCLQELGGGYMVGDQDIRETSLECSANGGDIGRASTCDHNCLCAFGDPLLEHGDRKPGEMKGWGI